MATGASFTLNSEGQAQYVPAARISFNFFDVLGVHPELGRNFLAAGGPARHLAGRAHQPQSLAAGLRRFPDGARAHDPAR